MKLSPAHLGMLAELRFQQRCVELGITCYAPIIGTNKAVDYVIERDGRLERIQVKKATISDNSRGSMRVKAQLAAWSQQQFYRKAQDYAGLFEFYAFVCHEAGAIWMIPQSVVTQNTAWSHNARCLAELDQYLL